MSKSTDSPSTPGRGRGRASPLGRGRGFGMDNSPLRKPSGSSDSSRNPSRPGSSTQSPRLSQGSTPDRPGPRTTVSDSSVGTSTISSARLDVAAAEFVPRTVKSLPALSVSAVEFVPAYHPTESEELIIYLESVLQELLEYPSRYDMSILHIADTLTSLLVNQNSMEIACDVIFEWALTQKNFSYTCARICEYLLGHVHNNHNGLFHQHMLKRCREENDQFAELMQTNPDRACSFTIFLAEFYTKDVGRFSPVMKAILTIMETMVAQLNDNLARTVGQVLKMCGACLEDDLMKECQAVDRMDSLMTAVLEKVNSGILSRSMNSLLTSAVNLRKTNWGRSISPAHTPLATPSLTDFSQEPVFFSTSGQRITREEAGYGEDSAGLDESDLVSHQNLGNWPTNPDVQAIWSSGEDGPSAGARGDFSEAEDVYDVGDASVDLDILVIEDEDEQMTEDMWAEYERFEAERDQNLTNYQKYHE